MEKTTVLVLHLTKATETTIQEAGLDEVQS